MSFSSWFQMNKRKIPREEEVIGGSEISKHVKFESASDSEIAEAFLSIERKQADELLALDNPSPIVFVYNPLSYAAEIHKMFIKKFCNSHKDVLFLGMNPGPWGMCQTGVGFAFLFEFLQVSLAFFLMKSHFLNTGPFW